MSNFTKSTPKMNRALCNVDDLSIDRGSGVYTDAPVLYNCDGERIFTFYLDGWTDDMVKEALAFANHAYRQGFEQGQKEKVLEIRRILDF